jgi:hypothetical protein
LEIFQSCVQKIRHEQLLGIKHLCACRPKALSSTQEKTFVRDVTLGGHDNASSVTKDVKKKLGVTASDWTIGRALRKARLSSRMKQRKPKLTPKDIREAL